MWLILRKEVQKQQLLESFKKEAFWQKLQATKNNRVYVFDYYGLVNPGSIDAIEKACQQLKQDLSTPQVIKSFNKDLDQSIEW